MVQLLVLARMLDWTLALIDDYERGPSPADSPSSRQGTVVRLRPSWLLLEPNLLHTPIFVQGDSAVGAGAERTHALTLYSVCSSGKKLGTGMPLSVLSLTRDSSGSTPTQ